MFSPHAHFLNICPRQVCLMISEKSSAADLIRYAMSALLNHATVSSGNPVLAGFYREYADLIRSTVKYRRHTAPGEGLCETTDKTAVNMSAYWKKNEAMLVFANLTEETRKVSYRFAPDCDTQITGTVTVKPLSIRTVIKKTN